MTYKIIDQQSETVIEFTPYADEIIDVTCRCAVTSNQVAFQLNLLELIKVTELLKNDLADKFVKKLF